MALLLPETMNPETETERETEVADLVEAEVATPTVAACPGPRPHLFHIEIPIWVAIHGVVGHQGTLVERKGCHKPEPKQGNRTQEGTDGQEESCVGYMAQTKCG